MNIDKVIEVIEDQVTVKFTGKINVLNEETKQGLGFLVLHEGDIVSAQYLKSRGLKAYYSIFVDMADSHPLEFIVEPEVIEDYERNIHYPFSVLTTRLHLILKKYESAKKNRPPGKVKLLINSDFLGEGDDVTSNEYDVLLTISDYNRVDDIYENCALLDFEITDALVSLRKKNAIKVVKQAKKPA